MIRVRWLAVGLVPWLAVLLSSSLKALWTEGGDLE